MIGYDFHAQAHGARRGGTMAESLQNPVQLTATIPHLSQVPLGLFLRGVFLPASLIGQPGCGRGVV